MANNKPTGNDDERARNEQTRKKKPEINEGYSRFDRFRESGLNRQSFGLSRPG